MIDVTSQFIALLTQRAPRVSISEMTLKFTQRMISSYFLVKGALIVSDEMKGSYQDDEILMKRHLTNIRKDIATENSRRMKLDALSSILSIQGDPSTDSVTDSPPARDCDVDRCSVHNLNFIESELQDLIDFGEGHHIVKRHQLLVQASKVFHRDSALLN